MPDLVAQPMQQCLGCSGTTANVGGYAQCGLGSERAYPSCTCLAYQYGRRTVNFGGFTYPEPCKHIALAQEQICGWHELVGEAQEQEGVCPRCGGPTETVMVAA